MLAFLVPYLIKSTAHCSVPLYPSLGTHLNLLKLGHQKPKGTFYMPGYQVQFPARLLLRILLMRL